jgi:FAD/FMN-containing dehydrogenase
LNEAAVALGEAIERTILILKQETNTMSETNQDVPRRSLLKQAAVGGLGLVAGGSLISSSGSTQTVGAIERIEAKDKWFSERVFFLSGNKVLKSEDGSLPPLTTFARHIYCPRSAQEISELVKSLPSQTPVACVCGGHESSNASLFASSEAIVLDLARMKTIDFHRDDKGLLVKVGAGVLFRELVEAVKGQQGALPVGTGPDVGVVGYIVNGGLSGYFSRRLGLLGQRVVQLTMVTASGDVLELTPGDERFTAMLGAGSALGIVVDVTIRLEHESILQSAEQRVISFDTREQARDFTSGALRFLRDQVLPNEAISMELVVTGTKALVATIIFYDTFKGSAREFVKPLEELAARLNLPLVVQSHWASWYDVAAALWPVIAELKGNPLATLQHCMGTKGVPDDKILDFISGTVVSDAPLDEANLSIVEIRTLGGATLSSAKLPSGNCHHQFFVDLVTMYDAKNKTFAERQAIVDLTKNLVGKARQLEGLAVDFSGTHSQPDDLDRSALPSLIFGTEDAAEQVKALKKKLDPNNRFRFHPFAKLL